MIPKIICNNVKVKITLGISRTPDVSAAMFKCSELLGIAETERVLEIKHVRGPDKLEAAIIELLAQYGISISEINANCNRGHRSRAT